MRLFILPAGKLQQTSKRIWERGIPEESFVQFKRSAKRKRAWKRMIEQGEERKVK